MTKGLLSLAFLAFFTSVSAQKKEASTEPLKDPILLVDGNLTKGSANDIDAENIESMHIYKNASSLPSELEGLKNHIDRALISIKLKKMSEAEYPVALSDLNQMNGLAAESPIYLDGKPLYHNDLKIYPSSIKEIEVRGTKRNPHLSIVLGQANKIRSTLRVPRQSWLLLKN